MAQTERNDWHKSSETGGIVYSETVALLMRRMQNLIKIIQDLKIESKMLILEQDKVDLDLGMDIMFYMVGCLAKDIEHVIKDNKNYIEAKQFEAIVVDGILKVNRTYYPDPLCEVEKNGETLKMNKNSKLILDRTKVELLSLDMQTSHEILEDLLNQMNEFPDFFELDKLYLKDGIISQDISEELLSEWFALPKDLSLFKLKCTVDFTKSFPRIILYESYLQESLDSGIYLKDLELQKGLFLIQDEKGISRLAGCVSKVNDFNECKGLILLWSRSVLLAFSRQLTENKNINVH